MAYRTGAFHHLAHQAWRGTLPTEIAPARSAAPDRGNPATLEPAGTVDAGGWLQSDWRDTAVAGRTLHQHGSLYLCSLVFHPLGLPATDRFWRDPAADWTQRRIWSGADSPADHALKET